MSSLHWFGAGEGPSEHQGERQGGSAEGGKIGK